MWIQERFGFGGSGDGTVPVGGYIWDEGRVRLAEALPGSWKVGDEYSICYGSEDKKHVIKYFPRFVPDWKGVGYGV
jgi:hypothetical protein